MAQHRDVPARPPMLFCPFCREGFENQRECPEHDLLLVPIDALQAAERHRPDRAEFYLDPRFGRGPVLFGAFLVLVGFAAPFVRSGPIRASALEVAIDGANNLWLTAGAAIVILWILWRRRERAAMHAARAAVFGLALGAVLPLLYTARRIELMAEAGVADVEWRWGAWVFLIALSVTALGSLFLGRERPLRKR